MSRSGQFIRLALISALLILVLQACSPASPVEETTPTNTPSSNSSPTPTAVPTTVPTQAELASFDVEFVNATLDTSLRWEGNAPYAGIDYTLPVSIYHTVNPEVVEGLTVEQRLFLEQNGFVVQRRQDSQFHFIQDSMREQGQPFYMTVDHAYHALHLVFDQVLKTAERDALHPTMVAIIKATYEQTLEYWHRLEGGPIEGDARLAAAYMAVALRLLDPEAEIDPALEAAVIEQIDQIMAEGGSQYSVLIPGFTDDYGAYRPVSHYAGDPALEAYFRGMNWLGRVHFRLDSGSRAPLLITLALREARLRDGRSAAEAWGDIHELLTYLIGPSDDGGPLEYAALMDVIYGPEMTVEDLQDDTLYEAFVAAGEDGLPAPVINSTFQDWIEDLPGDTGWRFMGQRFTFDGNVMQQLIYNAVEDRSDGARRLFPTGPDVMAVLGSPMALDAVIASGQADYPNYLEQVELLQTGFNERSEATWLATFYDTWLYSFISALQPKDARFPAFMQTEAWAYREMNSALGSWVELKHDTILYTKMPEGLGGGGPPYSPFPPSYVDANPDAFFRMAFATQALQTALNPLLTSPYLVYEHREGAVSLEWALSQTEELREFLEFYGQYATAELTGTSLPEDDQYMISRCPECLAVLDSRDLDPLPVVAAVSGANESVLTVATGYVDRIYVIVPIDGELMIAQGGVFSYYEFLQARSNRLTDEAWRERLAGPDAPAAPPWASQFVFEGGAPVWVIGFRIGDNYHVQDGISVNVHAEPSENSPVVGTINDDVFWFSFDEGPVEAEGNTWWHIGPDSDTALRGWVIQNRDWYSRW